jgi:HAD superfamily hydrolase (TIGR01459 family)
MSALNETADLSKSSIEMVETIHSSWGDTMFPCLESISQPFDGILLDAYGVFWGGNDVGLLPGSKETMARLVAEGKIVGILSNATQLADHEVEKLKKRGLIQGQHYHFLITSGTVAKRIFINDELPFSTPHKKFYLFGEPHPKFTSHQALFHDTLFQETTDLQQADFIYISIPHIDGNDQTDPLLFKEYIATFKDVNLPIVCVNPDRFAHEGSPPRPVVRQGSIALMYEEQGAEVFYVGKPSEIMYAAAMESFLQCGISDPQKVLMVGDTPETDIRGARNFGMPAALIMKTGIMADRISREGAENALRALPASDWPDFFISYFV